MDKSERPFYCSFWVLPKPQIDTRYFTPANNPKTCNLQPQSVTYVLNQKCYLCSDCALLTSNSEPRTPNLELRTSNSEPRTPNLEPRTGHRRSGRSEADRPGSEQRHHRKAGAAVGVAETGLGLYHSCRVEHRARIFGSRRSAISHPDNL